jgi:cyanophycinase
MPLAPLRLILALAISLLGPMWLALPCSAAEDPPAKAGSLVIVGGGGMPDDVRDRFVELAGGKDARIVVIPTASEAADDENERESYLKPWRKYQPKSIDYLHTRSREKADDPAFVAPIDKATAVWFGGGDQSKITAAYRDTAVHRALRALLARGGVIGGTSAGAAIMSDVMIEGGNPRAEVGSGLGFTKNLVVDQHFLARSRINRLLGVVAERPGLVGIGIDEATAFVITGDRWSVLGKSFVLAIAPSESGPPLFESFRPGDVGRLPERGMPVVERRRPGEDD